MFPRATLLSMTAAARVGIQPRGAMMEIEYDLVDQLRASLGDLKTSDRALRMRLAYPKGGAADTLLPQRISGSETICGGITEARSGQSDGGLANFQLMQRDAMHIAAVRILTEKK
jgi:hypothetical protein